MIPLLITAVTAAAAQPAAKPVDPAALTAATALVQQLNVRAQILAGMNRTVDMMRQGVAIRAQLAPQPGFMQAYQANQAKFDAAFKKAGAIQADATQKVVNANIDSVVAEAARIYARNFTADELRQLSAFYKTPLGLAVLQKQGRVSAEISQAGETIMGPKVDAAMRTAEPQIKAALAPLNSGGAPPAKPATRK
jgi:hypothetical protein